MAVRALITALAALAGLSAPALARPFDVPVDHAALVRLPDDASAVVIGNPAIADATLYDARTLFVTGKLYGRTNLIALDGEGRVIYTSDLVVSQTDRGTLEVFRNVERDTYVCAPECEAAPAIGDSAESFGARSGQQQDRISVAGSGNGANASGDSN